MKRCSPKAHVEAVRAALDMVDDDLPDGAWLECVREVAGLGISATVAALEQIGLEDGTIEYENPAHDPRNTEPTR